MVAFPSSISTFESSGQTGGHQPLLIWLFLSLQLFGFIGASLLLLLVASSKTIKRYSTWFSFCISWIISSFSYLFLFIAGQQMEAIPNHAVCLIQACLVYAAPVLTGLTALSVALQIWHRVSSVLEGSKESRIRTIHLLIVPYVAFVSVFIAALVVGIQDPLAVQKESGMYCGIINGVPGRITASLVMCSMIAVFTFGVLTSIQLFKNWRVIREIQLMDTAYTSKWSLTLIFRFGIFAVAALVSVILGIVFLAQVGDSQDPANIALACLPVAFTLIFGSQPDVLRVLAFWRGPPPPLPPPKDFVTLNSPV